MQSLILFRNKIRHMLRQYSVPVFGDNQLKNEKYNWLTEQQPKQKHILNIKLDYDDSIMVD